MTSGNVEILMQRMRDGDPDAASEFLQSQQFEIERHAYARLPVHWRRRSPSPFPALVAVAVIAAEPVLRRFVENGMMAEATTRGIWRGVTLLVVRAVLRIIQNEEEELIDRVPDRFRPPRPRLMRPVWSDDAAFERMLVGLTDGFDKAIARWLRAGLCAADIAVETGRREWDIRARIDALPGAIRRFIDGEDNGAGVQVPV